MRADYRTVKGYGESEFIIQKSDFLHSLNGLKLKKKQLDFIIK